MNPHSRHQRLKLSMRSPIRQKRRARRRHPSARADYRTSRGGVPLLGGGFLQQLWRQDRDRSDA